MEDPQDREQAELEYYKRMVDQLSARVLELEYQAWGAGEQVSHLRKAFSLIDEIESDIVTMMEMTALQQKLVAGIAGRMRMDRTILFASIDATRFRPVAWNGFSEREGKQLSETRLLCSNSIVNTGQSLLVNSKTEENELIRSLRTILGVPYFICSPIRSAGTTIGLLIVGRMYERLPDFPPFGNADTDIYESFGGLLRTAHLYHLELERRVEMERERLRISADMHDEVGANLTKIAIMSELAQRTPSDVNITEHLQRISRTSREVIDSIGNIIWAINPKNDTVTSFAGYIREYAAEFLEPTAIRIRFSFPDELPDIRLSAEARRNVFLVVKEALHNIVKHSSATDAHLSLVVNEHGIEITVEDDGKGFDTERIRAFSNGLQNMRRRMESVDGTCEIRTRSGVGTSITLHVPRVG